MSSSEQPHTMPGSRSGQLAGSAAAAILAVSLLTAGSAGTYLISGKHLTGMEAWPEPLGWITQLLVIESWPTYETIEIRWLIWALGAVSLLVLAVAGGRRAQVQTTAPVLAALAAASTLLAMLVAVRAAFSTVPVVGLAWAWQLILALLWMLTLYVWTHRVSIQMLTRAIALATSVLAAISLLCCAQSGRSYPTWPSGNVLLLTTSCLVGLFLLATWVFERLVIARRTGNLRDWVTGLVVAGVAVLTMVALWMAGRRAAVLGLASGAGFIVILALLRRSDLAALDNPRKARGFRLAALGVVLAGLAAGGVMLPRLLSTGRWVSVLARVEMYKTSASFLLDSWGGPLVGIGPGHLVFPLTAHTRLQRAESPAMLNGRIAEHAHCEPLHAIVELGLPLGLLYLALPLGGLAGFAAAYRRTQDASVRPVLLGAGAALAAALAAEATSVGMRHAGVAMLVWTLAGMGWACGAQAGGFRWLVWWRWAEGSSPSDTARPQTARAWHPASSLAGMIAIMLGLVVLGLAWVSVRTGGDLYQAQQAWSQRQFAAAESLLNKVPWVTTGGSWMAWKYAQGRVNFALMVQESSQLAKADWRTRAMDALGTLNRACPAYEDAPVWLAKADGDWGRIKQLCEDFLRYDPYNSEALLLLASRPGATPVEKLQALRLSIRNESVSAAFSGMATQAVQDSACRQLLDQWVAAAQQSLQQPSPSRWSDPLAPESLRMAIVVAAQQGRFTEALGLADQAAILLECLAGDPWRSRLETVETEVRLNQAWFGWLVQSGMASSHLATMEDHLRGLGQHAAQTYSGRMAAQFAAMLWLSQDQVDQASHALYAGNPMIDWPAITRMEGMACARLVTLMGPRVPASQVETWTRRGRALLGESLWQQALRDAAAGGAIPWWFGVLGE